MAHSGFPTGIKEPISRYHSAFLFGHVAPDVQVISGQTRESTHFYILPTQGNRVPPWRRIIDQYSVLSCDDGCTPAKVFIAGYLCHLQADWIWSEQIFEPYFGPSANWKSFRERLYLHNVLRSYLDAKVLGSIKSETINGLAQVRPNDWLPFVRPNDLDKWRKVLTNQFEPGALIQTVEVFASRQGISAEKYYHLLNTEDEMETQVFRNIPRTCLDEYKHNLIQANIKLLTGYLTEIGGS